MNTRPKPKSGALISKLSYGQIVKGLDKLIARNNEDRAENPHLTPIGFGSSLETLIEGVLRANHERCPRDLPPKVMEYLCAKGLIVPYAGSDYSFPNTQLPSREEIVERTLAMLTEIPK